MKNKIVSILIHLAHLSEKLKIVSTEIDNIYELIGNKEFLAEIEKLTAKE